MNLYPNPPIEVSQAFKTDISRIETGQEFRRARWLYPLRAVKLKYENRPHQELNLLWQFYKSVKGAFEPFYFVFPIEEEHENEFVAQANGYQKEFQIPSRQTSQIKCFINGVEEKDFVLLHEAGEKKIDKISFKNPPKDGAVITIDFIGYLTLKMRFAEDNLSKQMFKAFISTSGITLQEIR